jgi:hypothetical protein
VSCNFYENEPKVAAAVDFYSQFSGNGFKLECKSSKINKYYERVVEKLELSNWLRLISFEYYLLGEVFPFCQIDCEECGGTGVLKNGQICNHPNGTIKKIVVLNPDWLEVNQNVLAADPQYLLIPDEELRTIETRLAKLLSSYLDSVVCFGIRTSFILPS